MHCMAARASAGSRFVRSVAGRTASHDMSWTKSQFGLLSAVAPLRAGFCTSVPLKTMDEAASMPTEP